MAEGKSEQTAGGRLGRFVAPQPLFHLGTAVVLSGFWKSQKSLIACYSVL